MIDKDSNGPDVLAAIQRAIKDSRYTFTSKNSVRCYISVVDSEGKTLDITEIEVEWKVGE